MDFQLTQIIPAPAGLQAIFFDPDKPEDKYGLLLYFHPVLCLGLFQDHSSGAWDIKPIIGGPNAKEVDLNDPQYLCLLWPGEDAEKKYGELTRQRGKPKAP